MSTIVNTLFGNPTKSFAQPQTVNIEKPVSLQQAQEQYGNVQQGLTQQQALLAALQQQGGLQNQSQVFNQLQQVSQGQGPNPALAALANATGQNVAGQAALMAGQRGASANAGLLARQIAQQGAGIQQQSAGQAAALQAQQQLGALGQMGGLANQQAAQQLQAQNAFNQAALQAQQQAISGVQGANQLGVQQQSNINQIQAQRESDINKTQSGALGGVLNAAGPALNFAKSALLPAAVAATPLSPVAAAASLGFMAEGGMVDENNNENAVLPTQDPQDPIPMQQPSGPQSMLGRFLSGNIANVQQPMMAKGGKVPALVSPGETYLNPSQVERVKSGASPLKIGEKIPGAPKHPGNDYRNDTVPKTLESGGIVIPNNVMQSKDKDAKARAFVAAVLAKKGRK